MFKDLFNKVKSIDQIAEFWPKIEKLMIEKALPLVEDKLKDDCDLEILFNKSFELLPIAIRLLTNRDKFLKFCMLKKESVYLLIKNYRLKQCKNESSSQLLSLKEDV